MHADTTEHIDHVPESWGRHQRWSLADDQATIPEPMLYHNTQLTMRTPKAVKPCMELFRQPGVGVTLMFWAIFSGSARLTLHTLEHTHTVRIPAGISYVWGVVNPEHQLLLNVVWCL